MITTERLELRYFRPEDAEAFSAYRSVPEVARFQSWNAPFGLEEAQAKVASFADGDPLQPGWFQYAIALDGLLIGDIGLNTFDNLMQADIGYTLAQEHQGKGYATEAVGGLLNTSSSTAICTGSRRRSTHATSRRHVCWYDSASSRRDSGRRTPGSRTSGPTTCCSAYCAATGDVPRADQARAVSSMEPSGLVGSRDSTRCRIAV